MLSTKLRSLLRLSAALALLGVLAVPAHADEADAPASCRALDAEQSGGSVPAANGVITLARQPFVLRLRSDGFAPGLHVAREPGLAKALAATRQRLLWLSGGDWLAGEPGRIIVDGSFTLHTPLASQTAFVAAFGQGSVRLLGPGAATAASPALAGQIPRNSEFESRTATGDHHYRVRQIDNLPIEQSSVPALHLVVFTARQGFPSEPASLFYRADWTACTLLFRP